LPNGTGGIFRKEAVYDAGGWSSDTLAEDCDLSLRIWLKGWDFVYLRNLKSPCEIPADFSAWRNQQERWVKGPIQVFKKQLKFVWKHKEISLGEKFNITFFFARMMIYPTVLVFFIFLLPIVYARHFNNFQWFWVAGLVWLLPFALESPKRFWVIIPTVAVETAMSIFKSKSLLSALLYSESGEFVRTPKSGGFAPTDADKPKIQVPVPKKES